MFAPGQTYVSFGRRLLLDAKVRVSQDVGDHETFETSLDNAGALSRFKSVIFSANNNKTSPPHRSLEAKCPPNCLDQV